MIKNDLSRTRRAFACLLAVAAAVGIAGCDKAQLVAPTKSSITVSAGARVLAPNGTTDVTAVVTEEAGTPVQNGTTVRFATTLGRVDPVEVQTRNGIAITTFFAGSDSGVARVRAISGAASGGTTTSDGTATAGTNNVVEITIGAAAVNTVTLRASPGSVGPQGGTVDLIASVVGENGQALPGITVTFTTDQGILDSTMATTDASGQARTTLTTTQKSSVTATAGTKTSSATVVDLRAGPILSITCAPTSGTGNCAAVQAGATSNTATVVFTVTKPTGSSTLRTATIDFGDGSSQALGNLAGGTATVTHTYSGPSGSSPASYVATVQATDINNEPASASTSVIVTPKPTITPIAVTIDSTCTASTTGSRCTFTATTSGGGETGTGDAAIQSYTWNFGDNSDDVTTSGRSTAHVYTSNGTFVVTVTVRTTDSRSAVGRTEVLIKFP
jgi:hypothetical protein